MGVEDWFRDFFGGLAGSANDTHAPDKKWDHLLGPDPSKQASKDVKKQEDLQREFAQHGIRWRVNDAIAAGIHPLAALGASGASYAPVLNSSADPYVGSPGADPNLETFARMGQSFGRSIAATQTREERAMAKMRMLSMRLDLEGKVLDNQIRASRVEQMSGIGPGLPSQENFVPGQGNSGRVEVQKKKTTAHSVGAPSQEAGWVPDLGFSRTEQGLWPVIPQGLSEPLEDDIIGKAAWHLRNTIPNFFGGGNRPSKSMLPPGADRWKWSPFGGGWVPVKGADRPPKVYPRR